MRFGREIRWGAALTLIALGLWLHARYGFATIEGTTMAPAYRQEIVRYLKIDGPSDVVLQGIVLYHVAQPGRDPIVVAGRVVGKPGDVVALVEGKVIRNGTPAEEWYLPAAEALPEDVPPARVPHQTWYVLGDNRLRAGDLDSRSLGPVPFHAIVGVIR